MPPQEACMLSNYKACLLYERTLQIAGLKLGTVSKSGTNVIFLFLRLCFP